MINNDKRNILAGICPEAVMFDNPSFDASIVGVSEEGGIVYNYDLMVEELMTEDNISYEEAAEFIDYNTIRTIPYTRHEGIPPVILYSSVFD